MSERITNLQTWLNAHGAKLTVDGAWGPATRMAVIDVFRNTAAPAAEPGDIRQIALDLGATERQLKAFANVESGGSGWDDAGLLKCLWERHYAWRRVKVAARWTGIGQAWLSLAQPGGYTIDADKDGINDSWEKLADMTGLFGFNAAAECASFGKFQIMGAHWKALGYSSVAQFVWQLSRTEAEHYRAFGKFIEVNNLTRALRAVDGDPASCTPIARGYNGKGQRGYDVRIAAAYRGMAG